MTKVDAFFKPKRLKFRSYHTPDQSSSFESLMGNHPDREIYVLVDGGSRSAVKMDLVQALGLLQEVDGLTVTTSFGETAALLVVVPRNG